MDREERMVQWTGKKMFHTTCHNMTVTGRRGEWLCLVAHPNDRYKGTKLKAWDFDLTTYKVSEWWVRWV
jgi:hypothetical protein